MWLQNPNPMAELTQKFCKKNLKAWGWNIPPSNCVYTYSRTCAIWTAGSQSTPSFQNTGASRSHHCSAYPPMCLLCMHLHLLGWLSCAGMFSIDLSLTSSPIVHCLVSPWPCICVHCNAATSHALHLLEWPVLHHVSCVT